MAGPIEGLRVLDCSRGLAGSRATGLLADYGADVVWVEPPGGDPCRRHEPAAASVSQPGQAPVELDLRDPAALGSVLALAERADVFVESWAPGVADRLGLGYAALHLRNPRLVYVSISGFGEDAPDIGVAGYEPIVQAFLGSLSEQVAHRDGPVFMGFPFGSIGAGYLAVIGALAALYRREGDGMDDVRTSVLGRALAYNSMMWGETDQSLSAVKAGHGGTLFQQTAVTRLITRSFECADGEYVGLHTGAVGAFGWAMKVLGMDDRVPPSETGMDIGVPLTPEQIPVLRVTSSRSFQDQDQGRVGSAVHGRRCLCHRASSPNRGIRQSSGDPQPDGRRGRRPGARTSIAGRYSGQVFRVRRPPSGDRPRASGSTTPRSLLIWPGGRPPTIPDRRRPHWADPCSRG